MVERVLPRDFPIPPEFLIPLSNAELQELGTFTAIWSQIDFIILTMVQQISLSEMGALNLIMETMTTGPRVGLLTKLCQSDAANSVKKEIKTLCDSHSGLIEDRNHIIHGLWSIEWDYGTGKTTPACRYTKSNRKPIYADKLPILSNRAAEFANELGSLLAKLNPDFKRGDPPHPFFFAAGSPVGHEPPPWPPK
jgi:hypothetical protein